MDVQAFKVAILKPPKDTLFDKIRASRLTLKDFDVIAVSSKVVGISEGRCVTRDVKNKEALIKKEADLYAEPAVHGVLHTINGGVLIGNAGIDPFGGYHVLWPKKPRVAAKKLLAWFKKTYRVKNLGLIIVDSRSVPLRRGAVGIAIAYAGFAPLYDNRKRKDLMGFETGGTETNLPDSLAAAAALVMGEANEQTPIARMRGVSYIKNPKPSPDAFELTMEQDMYSPILKSVRWKKGG